MQQPVTCRVITSCRGFMVNCGSVCCTKPLSFEANELISVGSASAPPLLHQQFGGFAPETF